MNPMVTIAALFATAANAAPSGYNAVVAPANVAVAAPAVAAVATPAVAATSYGVAAPAVAAVAAPAVSVPAPYTTEQVHGAPVTTISQAPPVVQKQLHYGKTQFVSGYASAIHKPAIPDFKIAVPTILKEKVAYNTPIVKTVKEPFVVNEPVPVEKRVQVPYDVPVYREQIHEVPVPVHVDKPYAAPYAVPVQGEPIINYRDGPAVVQRTHSNIVAPTKYVHAGHTHTDLGIAPAAIAAAPAAVAHY